MPRFDAGIRLCAWHTEHFDTRFRKALRNDGRRGAGFLLCDQFVNGESKDPMVFTKDAKEDVYDSYSMRPGGGSGKLLIKGHVWTFPREGQEVGKALYFGTAAAKGLEQKLEKAR